MIRLDIGSASVVGQVRAGNEDSVLVADGLAAVADGMGGHRAGEVASADAVDALSVYAKERYRYSTHNCKTSFSSPYYLLYEIVEEINSDISHPIVN